MLGRGLTVRVSVLEGMGWPRVQGVLPIAMAWIGTPEAGAVQVKVGPLPAGAPPTYHVIEGTPAKF
jgi:hypothetical protein